VQIALSFLVADKAPACDCFVLLEGGNDEAVSWCWDCDIVSKPLPTITGTCMEKQPFERAADGDGVEIVFENTMSLGGQRGVASL